MANVIHTIKGHQYLYEHYREGNKVICKYLYPCNSLGSKRKYIRNLKTVSNNSPKIIFDNQNVTNHISQIKNLDYEVGIVIDSKTGKTLKQYKGEDLSVNINPNDFKLHRENIFLHNHPISSNILTSSLSLPDIQTLGHGGFKEMIAVTPTDNKYSLKITSKKGTIFCLDYNNELKDKYSAARKKAHTQYTKESGKFLRLYDKNEEYVTHLTIKYLIKDVEGLEYTHTKI